MDNKKEVRTKFTTLFLDPVVMKKIMYYTQAADGEVSGLGVISKDNNGRHIVSNVYLLEQEASAADTELQPEAISKLMVDMLKSNQDPAAIKFWWHSHAHMGVFWSGTDDTCAETLSREFAFSLVVNKKGEKRCRLDLYEPFRITFDGVKVEELIQEDKDLKDQCEKEVKEKVKTSYQKWGGWERDTQYNNSYTYRKKTDNEKNSDKYFRSSKRINLPNTIVNDIERLMDLAGTNSNLGGIMCKETWNEYLIETLKDVIEKRFAEKAECNNFGTYIEDYELCKGACKVKKECSFWTKFFSKIEEDSLAKAADIIHISEYDSND